MASPILQFKRGLSSSIPNLRTGEPGYGTDKYDFYIGIDTNTAPAYFGSARYWIKEDGASAAQLRLVDKDGTNYVSIAASNTLAGNIVYNLPATQGGVDSTLTNDGNGNLRWASGSSNAEFTGITTFSDTTDNTLGDVNTGAVQIRGGAGIAKNLTVGAGLSVGGQSYFIGTATFYGGQINLGDSDADDINVAGEFISNLIPNADDTYDIGQGDTPKRWRHANFSGVGTFASGVDANDVNIGLSGANEIDTSSGVLILDSAAGQVQVDDELSVSGIATFTSLVDANGGASIDNVQIGISGDNEIDTSTGNLTIDSAGGLVTVDDDLTVTGEFSTSGITTLASAGGITTTGGDLYVGQDLYIAGNSSISNVSFTGITTFTDTTDNTLGDADTGAVQIDGGVGINKNVTIGQSLYVTQELQQIGLSTFTAAVDVNGGLTANTLAVEDLTDNRVLIAGTGGEIEDDGNLTYDGTDLSTNSLIVTDLTDNRVLIAGTSGAVEDSGNLTFDGTTLTVTGAAVVDNLSLDSNTLTTTAGGLTLDSNSGTTTVDDNLIVTGDLTIQGNTTSVDTVTLRVEDRTIELGAVNGAAPSAQTTWDLGVLFNWHDGSDPFKAGVVWEQDDQTGNTSGRFVFGQKISETNPTGTTNNDPQISFTSYAPIEVAELWVNNTCTGGSSQVIACSGTELALTNITVDGGTW